MAALDSKMDKQPFKMIEIPLNKFLEEVIPHHQEIFERHKIACQKLIGSKNIDQLCKEVKDKDKVVKQLKDLMYELDTLRAHVEDEDLDKFDAKTLSLRKNILTLVNGYKSFKDHSLQMKAQQENDTEETNGSENPFENVGPLQIHANIDDVKLQNHKDCLGKVEAIEDDVKDLHEIYSQLNEMVNEQRIDVEHIEESVTSSNNNIQAGLRQLIKAHKLKATAYSATGAFLGGIVGGPIGLVAGFKVGALAALGCAVAGFTGGRYLKKISDSEVSENPHLPQEEQEVPSNNGDKKDI